MNKKRFAILLASTVASAFLGAFLATNLALGAHFQPQLPPPLPIPQNMQSGPCNHQTLSNAQTKLIKQQQTMIAQMDTESKIGMKQPSAPDTFPFISNHIINADNTTSIKTEETKDTYKIKINLKPFNNDPKNINIKLTDNSITVSGHYKSKKGKEEYSADFNQSLRFPFLVKKDEVKKQKSGNELIITVEKVKR